MKTKAARKPAKKIEEVSVFDHNSAHKLSVEYEKLKMSPLSKRAEDIFAELVCIDERKICPGCEGPKVIAKALKKERAHTLNLLGALNLNIDLKAFRKLVGDK